MFSWVAGRVLSHSLTSLRAGEPGPLLMLDAKDIRFRFPGESSWATDLHGKAELARWLARFADSGIQIYADEVIVKGPPWRQTLCVRGTDHLKSPSGELVYENRYVIWGRLRWGLLREYEVYADTQKAAALDEYLTTA